MSGFGRIQPFERQQATTMNSSHCPVDLVLFASVEIVAMILEKSKVKVELLSDAGQSSIPTRRKAPLQKIRSTLKLGRRAVAGRGQEKYFWKSCLHSSILKAGSIIEAAI